MSNTNTNLQTQTSNALHNAIMEAGGKDRPPMLAPGNYVQWKSRIKRYIDTKPNNELIHYCLQNPPYKFKWTEKTVTVAEGSFEITTEGYMENYKTVSQDIRYQLNAAAEAIQIILTGIDNDIYSTVDACPNAYEMWKAIERFYKMMNELVRNQCDVTNHQVNVQFLLQLQPEWQRFVTLVKQSQELKTVSYHKLYDILKQHQTKVNEIRAERLARTANPLALVAQQQPAYHPQNHPNHHTQNSSTRSQQATRNRGKAIVNSSTPIYDQEPATVTEDDEMSKEKEIDKLMALISLSFKKIYKPTNNNLRTSSNTSRANQDNSPRINRGTGYENQRVVNVAGARENVGTPVVPKSGIQCYNCKEYGHVSRECQKPKRAKDAAYHKEKMLLCKQEEAGVQLNAEQADWKDDTDDESDDQELEAHYMYMAQIQEVTPDIADISGPIFDTEPLQKVQNNHDNYNVFAIENEHPEQPESVTDAYLEEQGDTNITIDSLDMCYDREQDDQDDADELAQERDLLASLIDKLKCEIDDSKNRNKFLESSHKALVDKLKGEIEDFKTKNKSLESSNNHFKEANNELSKTNQLMFKDLKKFQSELDKYHDVNYASKVAIDCAKAKGDLMSYKIESEKSSNEYTQKINDLNQTISDMKKELFAYQETISIMSREKEAQIKFYKTREDKELDKVIALENKVKVLDDIVYKTGQSVQTMNMLNRNCKTSFAKPEFLKKGQRANPRLYDIGCYNDSLAIREYYYADHMNAILGVYTDLDEVTNLQCDYLETLEKCEHLEKELSKSRSMSKSFEALQKHAINLELDLQQCKEKIKNDKSFKENQSNVFLKEREQYFEIQDLKAQLQDKGIAISELKKLIEKMKGKSVETKFEKSSIIRQPNAFKSQRQSVLGKPAIFSDSLEKKDFSKSKSVTKNNVSNDFSKPITAQILPQNIKSILKNTNVIAPGMYKVHTEPNQTRTQQMPQDIRKTNKRVSFSTGVIPTTSVSRPQLKSNRMGDSVMPNNSQGKKQEVEEHRRNFKFSNNKTSVTACNDSLNAKTTTVNFVCVTCGKCVLNDNHDLCVLHYINGVNSRTRQPIAVPISTREPKQTVNQSVATSHKKTVATDSTVKNPRNIIRKIYEQVSKTCSWWYPKFTPPGYKWKPKSPTGKVNPNVSMPLGNASRTANILEHMTPRRSTMSNTPLSSNSFAARSDNSIHRMVKFRNDQIAPILGYGDLVQGTITIKRVYYVEGLNHNLFSIGQFCDADLEVAFRKSTCYIRDLKGNDLLTGSHGTDMYSITLQDTYTPNLICLMAKATSSQAWLWHRRLSHLNFDTINLLSKNNIVTGLPKLKFIKDNLCSSCELRKAKRKSFHTKTTPSSKRRLQLLHMDLCGPMRVESINGKKYVLVIVDDYSRYTWTHFLRSKDETPEVLIDFLTLVQRRLHAQVRTIRTDKGTEFLNKTIHAYFAKEGIRHETSTAQTPEQNGIVERRNRTLVKVAQTMLSVAKVPLFFWAEAITTACFTQNCSLVIPRHEKTPYHIINGRKLSVKFFHIFGSLCYIVRDGENLDKMKEKVMHVFFRMASDHDTETVTTSNEMDLLFSPMFDELLNGTTTVVSKSSAVTPADTPDKRQQQHTTSSSTTTVDADAPRLNIQTTPQTTNQAPTHVPTINATENIIQAETNNEFAQVDDDEFVNVFSTPVQERGETSSRHVDWSNMHIFYQHHPSAHHWTKDHPLEQVIGNPSQSIRTRRQLETDGEFCMYALTVSRTEPKNIKEAMADFAWIEAMQEEHHQFDQLDVWELVDRPLYKNVINLKWL
ncbi:retrovirus-related pol polyprotein from transposon TNT 1-94 [Tanacetum coccineum]